MSKSKKNYPPPEYIMKEYGADALRAYLINSPIVRGEPLQFSEEGVKGMLKAITMPLKNSWSFFVQYANLDKWDTSKTVPLEDRTELDRWLISRVNSLVLSVDESMDTYRLDKVIPLFSDFVNELTNWYIRLSRERFWREESGALDKNSAYSTLYETLVILSKALAPFMPFLSEDLYRGLTNEESVHYCNWPEVSNSSIDKSLELSMDLAQKSVKMGRRLRSRYKLRNRQPLASVTIVETDPVRRDAFSKHLGLIKKELNVKDVILLDSDHSLSTLTIKANFGTLGKVYRKDMRKAAVKIASLTEEELAILESSGLEILGHMVYAKDIVSERVPKDNVKIETDRTMILSLDGNLSDELIDEGIMREMISSLQLKKKESFGPNDRIVVTATTRSDRLLRILKSNLADEIIKSVLIRELILIVDDATGILSTAREEYSVNWSLE